MPLDPLVDALLQQLAAAGEPPLKEQTVAEARLSSRNIILLAGEPIPVGDVSDIEIPVDDASITARLYHPTGDRSAALPVVVYIHGGGWVICDLDTHDNVARAICRDANVVVVSLAYRMAPEFAFPTPVLDCYAATSWIAANASHLGGDGDRLAICGDSAGGNLSAVVSQMARDRGTPSISYTALIYPATDMTDEGGSMIDNGEGYFLDKASMEWFSDLYAPKEQRADPMASPLLHPDLTNLPPTFVAVCEFDPLVDQGTRYANALTANGVPTELKLYEGQIHAIANMTGVLPGGRQLVSDVAARLGAALHR